MAKKKRKPATQPPPAPWPERLKALRRDRGWTQAEAAALIRASLRSWVAWEKGEAAPAGPAQLLIEMIERGIL